jgi:hypothetical protein
MEREVRPHELYLLLTRTDNLLAVAQRGARSGCLIFRVCIARFGRIDEWQLDFAKTLNHFKFDLSP